MKPFDLAFIEHSKLLCNCYQYYFKEPLVNDKLNCETQLYNAAFVVVSHGTEVDPIFNYANLSAQNLWQYDWDTFTSFPSKLSAEDVNRQARSRMLEEVKNTGCSKNYEGIRINKKGERFRIKDVFVWNLFDQANNYRGQAACFSQWSFL